MTRRTPPPPMTPQDMRAMREAGEPVSAIIQRAYIRNRMNRAQVREILFGAAS